MESTTQPVTPLRQVLQDQGRMQKWLGEQVGCHPSEISDYCRGVHVPEEATRAAIADVLGTTTQLLWPETPAEAAA